SGTTSTGSLGERRERGRRVRLPAQGGRMTLDEPYKVLRLPEDLTRALDEFLGAHIPEYNTVDDISLQVETPEAAQDEPYAPETTRRYFLVDFDADGDGPTPINAPKEAA